MFLNQERCDYYISDCSYEEPQYQTDVFDSNTLCSECFMIGVSNSREGCLVHINEKRNSFKRNANQIESLEKNNKRIKCPHNRYR